MKFKPLIKKTWNFLIHEDSVASFIVDAILIIILGRFVIYPLLGLLLSTSFPVVAVVSSSMDHHGADFGTWWTENSELYEEFNITKAQFESFYLKNGFNKGDIFIVKGRPLDELQVGDIIVYRISMQKDPIIHRIVAIDDKLQTKGDANPGQIYFEKEIEPDQIYGEAILKIPYLGWIKALFVDLIGFLNTL